MSKGSGTKLVCIVRTVHGHFHVTSVQRYGQITYKRQWLISIWTCPECPNLGALVSKDPVLCERVLTMIVCVQNYQVVKTEEEKCRVLDD